MKTIDLEAFENFVAHEMRVCKGEIETFVKAKDYGSATETRGTLLAWEWINDCLSGKESCSWIREGSDE